MLIMQQDIWIVTKRSISRNAGDVRVFIPNRIAGAWLNRRIYGHRAQRDFGSVYGGFLDCAFHGNHRKDVTRRPSNSDDLCESVQRCRGIVKRFTKAYRASLTLIAIFVEVSDGFPRDRKGDRHTLLRRHGVRQGRDNQRANHHPKHDAQRLFQPLHNSILLSPRTNNAAIVRPGIEV